MSDDVPIESLVEERQRKERHLVALSAFMDSEAYVGYRSAGVEDIKTTEESIVIVAEGASQDKDLFEILRLAGELRNQRRTLETFEDARESLKSRIDEIVNLENEIASTRKV